MVLADLGTRLHGAWNQLSKASVIDDKVSCSFTVPFGVLFMLRFYSYVGHRWCP